MSDAVSSTSRLFICSSLFRVYCALPIDLLVPKSTGVWKKDWHLALLRTYEIRDTISTAIHPQPVEALG